MDARTPGISGLAARAITVRAGSCPIVHQANLSLRAGEFVGLIGPNGAGKSTLIRALAGVLRFTEGEVLLDGQPVTALTLRERAKRIAYLPQERQVEWAISVREVVALGRYPYRNGVARPSGADETIIDEALARVEVQGLASRSVQVLSGGERARVLLARALAVRAPILLADEPIAALDPFYQLQVMEVLRHEARRGAGVLCVLHDMALAARFLDRVVVMREGEVVADGPPGDVLDRRMLESVYGVSPLAGEHDGERWLLPWRRISSEKRQLLQRNPDHSA